MSPRISLLADNSVIVSCTNNDSRVFIQRILPGGNLLFDGGLIIEHETQAFIAPQWLGLSTGELIACHDLGPEWGSGMQRL